MELYVFGYIILTISAILSITGAELQAGHQCVSMNGILRFKAMATNDVHIALMISAQTSDPTYEFVIGGWANTKSAIRKKNSPESLDQHFSTPGILDPKKMRGFWVKWNEGTVSVGRETDTEPFMKWTDPHPFPVLFYGLHTGFGATGTWSVEGSDVIYTPNSEQYVVRRIPAQGPAYPVYPPYQPQYLPYPYNTPYPAYPQPQLMYPVYPIFIAFQPDPSKGQWIFKNGKNYSEENQTNVY